MDQMNSEYSQKAPSVYECISNVEYEWAFRDNPIGCWSSWIVNIESKVTETLTGKVSIPEEKTVQNKIK